MEREERIVGSLGVAFTYASFIGLAAYLFFGQTTGSGWLWLMLIPASMTGVTCMTPLVESEKGEVQSGYMRLAVMLVLFAWLGIAYYTGHIPLASWNGLVAVMAVMFPAAIMFLYLAKRRPGYGLTRQLLRHTVDYGSISAALIFGGGYIVPIAAALLWITVGTGLRYGPRALPLAQVFAVASFAAVVIFNDFWRAQWVFALTFVLIVGLVPVYLYIMLRRLELAHEETAEISLSKSRFLAQASHDLRQPIHAISLFTSCLRDAGLAPRELAMVDNIDRSLESVSRLFKSLLDVASLDSGRLSPNVQAFALQEVIDDVVQQNQTAAEQAGMDLLVVPTGEWVETDRNLLTTMLQNVVNNAVKYAPGAPVLVGARRRDRAVDLWVVDRGQGIGPEHQNKVFDEFYQVREQGDRDVAGVGLGLPIVRRMADLLGLRVELYSEVGRGTRLSIGGLPRVKAAEPEVAEASAPGHVVMAGLRVLLVEDDEAVAVATASLLSRWGCAVTTVAGIPAAVPQTDLLVTDFDLGGKTTGKDCIEAVRRALGREVPTIVVTGHDAARVREDLGDVDVAVLSKPVRKAELLSILLATAAVPANNDTATEQAQVA